MDHSLYIVPPHQWDNKKDVSACQQSGCGRSFTMFSKAANCNACGKVMCQTCLGRQLTLPGQPGSAPVPLCHGCAVLVAKAQAEAENAYQQRSDLMRTLDEQKQEMERLLTLSSSLRSENERLLHLTEELGAENEQLLIKNKNVEVTRITPPHGTLSSSSSLVSGSAVDSTVVLSNSKEDSVANANTTASGNNECSDSNFKEQERLMEESLRKREGVLNTREAALREAMKKLSSDVTSVAAQRIQLREEEKRFKAHLAEQFDIAIEEEYHRLQDVHLGELSMLGTQFNAWLESATLAVKEAGRDHCSGADEREVSSAVDAGAEVEALKREHAAQMTQKESVHQEQLAQLKSSLEKARLTYQDEVTKKEKRFSEDFSVMQNAVSITKRQLEEEKKLSGETQCALDILRATLQEERQQQESICRELRERFEAVESGTNAMADDSSGVDDDGSSPLTSDGNGNRSNPVVGTETQLPGPQYIAQAVYAALSQWSYVSETVLSEHSISLECMRQTMCAFCSEAKTLMSAKTNEVDTAKDFEERAKAHALEVASLKCDVTMLAEQKQQLYEKLSRTEKALLLASGIEKRLSKQLHEEQQKHQRRILDADNNRSFGVTALELATQILTRSSSYADGCTRLLGDSLLQHFDIGLRALQQEWGKHHALTRRNTVALEQTTASIKAFQEGLNRREEELRAREREARVRRARLLKVSSALQTIAGRLRVASTTEDIDAACRLSSD